MKMAFGRHDATHVRDDVDGDEALLDGAAGAVELREQSTAFFSSPTLQSACGTPLGERVIACMHCTFSCRHAEH